MKHIRKINIDPLSVGEGMLDLTWDNARWPLYRVQIGAFYYQAGQEVRERQIKDIAAKAGVPMGTYMVKY